MTYDDAGDITNDDSTSFTYDAEGRICAMRGPEGMIGYQYDGEGNRVGKGTVTTTLTCDITLNGYVPTTDYILDASGGQVTEMAIGNGTATWVHSNVMANGALLASYDGTGYGLHFYLNDALGSRRVQTDTAGIPEQICQNLPFGDQLYCTGSLDSPTEHHFTGKERDTESGLDYFGARYYGSSMGRFMSPDPSGLAFADPENPQGLNLYSYVLNNPLSFIDPDGMECVWDDGSFDSADDKQIGSHSGCSSQGGTYVDPKAFSTLNAGDWSNQANSDIAAVASTLSGDNNFTNVSVNADGSGYVDQTYMNMSNNVPYMLKNDSSQGPDPITQLATDVTADANHMTGCIAQAYVPGVGGNAAAGAVGRPVASLKPFAARGSSQGTSAISKGLSAAANKLGIARSRYPSPTGGLFADGQPFVMRQTGNLGRAAGRWAPYAISAASTAYASYQLWNCLGH